MAVIHVLDKHTAELIAAGEVVERPASVVKELVENAIDAGATQITVTVENGGIRYIEVSDNGSGIEAEYIDKAFVRHATSKIQTPADLDRICTLGFRGEALASIASVARVQVLTKTEADEFACDYRIEGGEEQGMEAGARGVGTTIRVRDLFYNTPARMKFLKKDASEGTYVSDVMTHTALSHPEISFRFVREGKTQYVTPGDGKLSSAAYIVLGREFARDLLPVDAQIDIYGVHGLITPPKSCRASRGMQLFFLNDRYVKNRTIMAALETAFKGTTMQGKFPGGILNVTMPADLVDVNVHPAKTEVRFAHENDVFEAVYQAVKQALAQPGSGERTFVFAGAPQDDPAPQAEAPAPDRRVGLAAVLPGQSEPGVPRAARAEQDILETPSPADQPAAQVMRMGSPVRTAPYRSTAWADERLLDIQPDDGAGTPAPGSAPGDDPWDTALPAGHEPPTLGEDGQPDAEQEPQYAHELGIQMLLFEEPEEEPLQYVGELFRTYIIAQRGDEVCLIDKHAAHERMLYEQLAKDYGNVPGQLLLSPVTVELNAEEKQALLEHQELLHSAGFDIDDFGGNTVAVREVPSDVLPKDVEDLVVEVAAKLAQGSRDALSEKTEWVLHSISCRAAMKAGDNTQPMQLMALADQILSGKVPPFCPHGRPCVLKLTKKELEKQFGRIV